MKLIVALIVALFIAGCASYDGRGLKPGISTANDVIELMGQPAMRWQEPGGGELLAYPRGPAGFQTYMVMIDSKGVMSSINGVLDMKHFAMIRQGMSKDEVLRILGPSQPQWTVYFEQRDELVWEWRYCDDWNEPARFDVLFDNTTSLVRSTQSYTEGMIRRFREVCGH